jgi:hypothetical protein
MKARTSDHREISYAPRGLRRDAAARWVGFSPSKFDQLVARGRFHKGKLVDGCRVWDRYRLDMEFDDLPDDEEESPRLAPAGKAWSDVR